MRVSERPGRIQLAGRQAVTINLKIKDYIKDQLNPSESAVDNRKSSSRSFLPVPLPPFEGDIRCIYLQRLFLH
jgi:hypothetical protein